MNDKNWLKEELDKLTAGFNGRELSRYEMGRLDGYTHASMLFDQLEEPEQTDTNVGLSKPVIPKFVADYIELNKGWSEDRQEYAEDDSSGLWFALNGDNQGMPNSVSNWLFNEEKVETFAKAWLDGYKVEKEKLYVVQLPTNLEDDLVILDVRGFIWKDTYPSKYKMTEQQIKDIDERYWAFAKEVTE